MNLYFKSFLIRISLKFAVLLVISESDNRIATHLMGGKARQPAGLSASFCNLFLSEKEKVTKRSKQPCWLTCFAAHQVCRTLVIGFRGYRQNGNFSNTRSQQLLKSRFTKELCKFDGRVLIHLHHANHGIPNRVGSDIPRFVGIVAILDASGASTKLWIFPPSYLAPKGL